MIRAAVLSAVGRGWEVYGIEKGYGALLGDGEVVRLDLESVRGITHLGGTILGAAFIDAAVGPDTDWAHLDIASTAWYEEDRPFSPKGAQGAAVRTLVELAATVAQGS